MNKKFKTVAVMVMALFLTVTMIAPGISASAASGQRYAYSVGVDHSPDSDLTGDFTGNVDYASTCYGMISGVTSYYQNNPTVAYLRSETNPSGVRKLASDIVFLNGHASSQAMFFGDSCGSGVYYGVNAYNDDYDFAGLKSISTMSSVDLISFVGCETAVGSENLASVARSKGATTSIGFTDLIYSRFYDGPEWLVEFHDYLTNGYTVQQSINYATAEYPGSDLGTDIKVYGSTSNTITSGARAMDENDDAIEVQLSGLQNCAAVPLSDCSIIGFDNLIDEAQRLYADFATENYKVSVNMYSEDSRTGLIALTYYVGNEIETNRAYIVTVEDGVATAITPSRSLRTGDTTRSSDATISEDEMLSAVASFKAQRANNNAPAPASISEEEIALQETNEFVRTDCRYFFDYSLNKLTYSETSFYKTSGPMGVFVDTNTIWELV